MPALAPKLAVGLVAASAAGTFALGLSGMHGLAGRVDAQASARAAHIAHEARLRAALGEHRSRAR